MEHANSEGFNKIVVNLLKIKENNNLDTEIYTLRRTEGAWEFVTMTDRNPYIGNKYIPSSEEIQRKLLEVSERGKFLYTPIYTTKGVGSWISAFAPVRASDGTIDGVLEVDYRVDFFYAKIKDRAIMIALVAVGFIVLALLLSLLLAAKISRPILQMTNISRRISKGNFNELKMETYSCSELNEMKSSFKELVNNMQLLSQQAEVISKDNLFEQILDNRIEGRLGNAFAVMVKNLRQMADQARVIASGDLNNPLLSNNSRGVLGNAFAEMVLGLKTLSNNLAEIADKKLLLEITETDIKGDLGKSFQRMYDNLEKIIRDVKESIDHIKRTSNEIMASAREAEQGAINQSSSVEEIKMAVESLSATSANIADNTSHLATVGLHSKEASTKGLVVVKSMKEEIEKIQRQNTTIAEKIMAVNTSSQQIENILDLIRSIAEKTDILALNAALEGTKAGEAGEGFSLVAMEMRRLAESVSQSANNIKELTKDIQVAVNSSVIATEEGIKLTQRGVSLAGETMEAFKKIQEMVEGTTESIKSISQITGEQKNNTEQVLMSIAEISNIIKESASGSAQITQSIIALSEMSNRFQEDISEFKLR